MKLTEKLVRWFFPKQFLRLVNWSFGFILEVLQVFRAIDILLQNVIVLLRIFQNILPRVDLFDDRIVELLCFVDFNEFRFISFEDILYVPRLFFPFSKE